MSRTPILEGPGHMRVACPGRRGAGGARPHHPLPVHKHKTRGSNKEAPQTSRGGGTARAAPSPHAPR